MKVVFNITKEDLDSSKKVYQCNICGKLFNWNKESSWYGSDYDSENNPDKIKYFCSDKCSNNYKQCETIK